MMFCLKDLMVAMECGDADTGDRKEANFVLRLLTLGQYHRDSGSIGSSDLIINLHGCLILQEILKFSKSDKVRK